MKNLLPIAVLILLLCSCDNTSPGNENISDLQIAIDTVMVNAGDNFINLRYGIYYSGLSHDKKFLYNSGGTNPYLEKINLETLKFEERVVFDEEGPNAFGENVHRVSSDVNNNLILTAWDGTSIFNLQKEKLKKYRLMGSNFNGDQLEGREEFISQIIPSEDYKTLFGLVQDFSKGDVSFVIINDNTKTLKKLRLDGFEKADGFSVTYSIGGGASIAYQQTEITRLGNKLMITNPAFSRIAVYDLIQKSLTYYDCKPTLTASEKVGKYNSNLQSMEEFDMERLKIKEEVTFLPLMGDFDGEKYVRLSIIGKAAINAQSMSEIKDYDVFITILNEFFAVVDEVKVEAGVGKLFTTPVPQKPFFKDGKVWLYLNVDDELAFVRLGLEH